MSSGTDKEEWNKELREQVVANINELRLCNITPVLIGDFNGHIKECNGNIKGIDSNGIFLEMLATQESFIVANRTNKCHGKWTWNRGDRKTEIDFVLIDKSIWPNLVSMTVDEEGSKWSIASDHSFIEVTFERLDLVTKEKGKPTKR